MFHTYVRSRSVADQTIGGGGGQLRYAAANLSFLEAMPLAGGLVAVFVVAAGRVKDGLGALRASLTVTDALAVVFAITFAILYADSLPLVAQYTVRYLFPLFPIAIYGLARLAPIRDTVAGDLTLVAWAFLATTLVAGQLLFAFVVVRDLAVSEAFQLHALLNLGLAAVLALTLSLTAVRPTRTRPAAIALGATAGATTVFILLSGIVYFPIGRYLLPIVEVLVDLIAAA